MAKCVGVSEGFIALCKTEACFPYSFPFMIPSLPCNMDPVLVLWWAAKAGRKGHVPRTIRAAPAEGRTAHTECKGTSSLGKLLAFMP